jgi:hypothetical protein
MDPNPEKTVRQALSVAKDIKAKALRRDPKAEIPCIVEFHRDDRLICRACGDIEEILPVLASAISCYVADAVLFVSDAYGYKAPDAGHINPITGKPWDIGDMERIATMDAGVERGLIQEMLMVHYEQRPGDVIWQGTVAYQLKSAGRRHRWVHWDDEAIYESQETVERRDEARIPRRIGMGWSTPAMISNPEFADWSQAQMDYGTTIFLDKVGLWVADGPDPVQIPDVERWFNS